VRRNSHPLFPKEPPNSRSYLTEKATDPSSWDIYPYATDELLLGEIRGRSSGHGGAAKFLFSVKESDRRIGTFRPRHRSSRSPPLPRPPRLHPSPPAPRKNVHGSSENAPSPVPPPKVIRRGRTAPVRASRRRRRPTLPHRPREALLVRAEAETNERAKPFSLGQSAPRKPIV
jgi:hypothetical protein